MGDAVRRLAEIAAADPDFAKMSQGRQRFITRALERVANEPPDPGAPTDMGLLASHQSAIGRLAQKTPGVDLDVMTRLLEQEGRAATKETEDYWKEHATGAAIGLVGSGSEKWTLGGALKTALHAIPGADLISPSVKPEERERLSRGYLLGLHAAIRDRLQEEQPELQGDALEAEVRRRMDEGGETVAGGVSGWLGEKLAPEVVGFGKSLPTMLAADAVATAVPFLAPAAADLTLARVGKTVGRMFLTGGAMGAAGQLDPEVQRQLDQAGEGFFSAAGLKARAKQALESGARMAAMGGVGMAAGKLFDKAVNWKGAKTFGGTGVRWERNPDLATFLNGSAVRTAALRGVRALSENVVGDIAFQAAMDPGRIARAPGAVLAESLAAAMGPAILGARARRQTPQEAATLRQAIADNVFGVTIDEALRDIDGLPLRHRLEVVRAYDNALAEQTARRGIAQEQARRLGEEGVAQANASLARTEPTGRNEFGFDLGLSGEEPSAERGAGPALLAEGEQRPGDLADQIEPAPQSALRSLTGDLLSTKPYELQRLEAIAEELRGRYTAAEKRAKASKGIPLTITRGMRQQLYDSGMSREQVDTMKPEDAAKRLGMVDSTDWADLAGRRARLLDAVESEIAARKLDPERARAGERLAEMARQGRSEPAIAREGQAIADEAANRVEAEAEVPGTSGPETLHAPPQHLWTAEQEGALELKFGRLLTAQKVVAALADRVTPAMRAQRTAQVEKARADIDATLRGIDGRGIDELAMTPHRSEEWQTNPALRALKRAGWVWEDAETGGRTWDTNRAKPLEPAEQQRVAKLVEAAGDWDRWLTRIVRENPTARRKVRDIETADALKAVAEDAATAFALGYDGPPEKMVDAARAAVNRAVAEQAQSYATAARRRRGDVEAANREAAQAITEAVTDASSVGGRAQDAEGGKPSLFAGIASDDAIEAALHLATQPGGPLHGAEDQATAVRLWLGAHTKNTDSSGKAPRLGWSFNEAARARMGDERWATMTPAAKAKAARGVQREFSDRLSALDRMLDGIQRAHTEAGFDITTDANGDPVAKPNVEMHGGIGVALGRLFGTPDTASRPTWGLGKRLLGRLGLFDRLYEAKLGDGERVYGGAEMAQARAEDIRIGAKVQRIKRAVARHMPEWRALSEESARSVGRALDGYRLDNNGVALSKELTDQRFRTTLDRMDPKERAAARSMYDFFRSTLDDMRAEILKANPSQPMLDRGYLMHVMLDNVVGAATLKEHFGEFWQRMVALKEQSASESRGRTPTGAPGSERLMHRAEAAPGEYELDPRKLARHLETYADFTRRFALHHYYDKLLHGNEGALRLPGKQPLVDFLNTFISSEATARRELLHVQLGNGKHRTAMSVMGGEHAPKVVDARHGTVEGSLIAEGGQRVEFRAGVDQDTGEIVIRRRSNLEKLNVTARQGGLYQMAVQSGYKDGRPVVDRNLIKIATERAEMISGKETLGKAERIVQGLMHWTSARFLGDYNLPVALKNIVNQVSIGGMELGIDGLSSGMKFVQSAEGRKLLRERGVWVSESVDPNMSAVKEILANSLDDTHRHRNLLPADATRMQKIVATLRDWDTRGRFMFNVGEEMMRGVIYGGALKRAERDIAKSGITPDEMRVARNNGIEDAKVRDAVAHNRAMTALAKTGGMIDIVGQPIAMKNPLLRLALQFQRPTLAIANHALSIGRTALEEAGRSTKQAAQQWSIKPFFNADLGKALVPIARWVAASTLLAVADQHLGTNLFGGLGPRVIDVGQDFGVSLADKFPNLDDPDEHVIASNVQIPLPSLGAGPALGLMGNLANAAVAMLRGDDEGAASTFWNSTDSKKRILESAIPTYQLLRRIATVADPTHPFIGPEIAPSAVPDKPWMVLAPNGRPVNHTTEDALVIKAVLGDMANRTALDEIREGRRAERLTREADRNFRTIRQLWYDAKRAYEVGGRTEDYLRMEELEAKAQGMQRELTESDAQREEMLRSMPAWMRQIGSGNTNNEKAELLLTRWKHLGPNGTGSMTKGELEFAINSLIKDRSSLSIAMEDALIQAVRQAER